MHATERERYLIRSLYEAGWTKTAISKHMGWTKQRIYYLLRQPVTPQKRSGRPLLHDTLKRREITQFIENNGRLGRDLRLTSLNRQFGGGSSKHTIRKALQKEGYARYIAKKRPYLTRQMRQRRLAWAKEMIHFPIKDWRKVLWSDESTFDPNEQYRQYKTRRKSQAYHQDCIIAKKRGSLSCMIWGAISGEGKGPLLFWDKKWGNINATTYCEHTLPLVEDFFAESGHKDFIFMQDLAPAHGAKKTFIQLNNARIVVLTWPANSPDLNPIEHVWREIKGRLYRLPLEERPTNLAALHNKIRQIWNELDQDWIQGLIDSMPDRLQAVIDAEGGHTKY